MTETNQTKKGQAMNEYTGSYKGNPGAEGIAAAREEAHRLRGTNDLARLRLEHVNRWIIVGLSDKPFATNDRDEFVSHMQAQGFYLYAEGADEQCPSFTNIAGPFYDDCAPTEARYETWDAYKTLSS